MFSANETVGWVSGKITYLGQVVSSNERITIVLVVSTDRRSKAVGCTVGVSTKQLQRVRSIRNADS